MPKTQTSRGSADSGTAAPFRYTAVVFGTGEIREIVESIGVRQTRTIDPQSREGRRLLMDGRVSLWGASRSPADRLPVGEFLQDMEADVRREWKDRDGDEVWDRHCSRRLQTLHHWQQFYRTPNEQDH